VRILLVTDYGFLHGGAETAILNLKYGLEERGDEVRVFSSDAGLKDNGSQAFADDLCRGTTSSFRTVLQTANPWASAALSKTLKGFQPDIVHLNLFLTQLSPLILPLLTRTPCIYHAHWPRAVCPTGTRLLPSGAICGHRAGQPCYAEGCLPLRDWIPLMAQMNLLGRWRHVMDRVVACSESLRSRLLEGGFQSVEVIPFGVPNRPLRPPVEEPPSAVFVGRMVPEKGVDILLRAFRHALRELPSARLHIAGAGPEEMALRSLAVEIGLADSVTFHGWLSPERIEHLCARAWVQLVPSVWEEPFGLVAAEAGARGTAAVVSDVGGLAEIVVQDETGLLVPPRDERALACALVRVLADRELAEAMGRSGRRRVAACFSMDRYIERFRFLYQELAAKSYAPIG
jgi:glycosyltransferase involved in cell wall biosynthesis